MRILCLDGGGVYGVMSATLLDRLAYTCPNLIENVDLIAGTSVGGILTLLLADGYSPSEIKAGFQIGLPDIFAWTWQTPLSYFGFISKYSNATLDEKLTGYFGMKAIGDLEKKVVVPAFALNDEGQWRAKIFHNFTRQTPTMNALLKDDRSTLVKDVAMATSAAPYYFPIYKGYIDGTLVDNNPTMCAVALSLDKNYKEHQSLDELTVLSIGREFADRKIDAENDSMGYLQWIVPLVEMILDRDSRVTHYQAKQMVGRYHRLSPVTPPLPDHGIDAVGNIPILTEFAQEVDLTDTEQWIKDNWQ
jgi:patatin-like phospholipase/acyl hydrolase